MRVHVVDLLGRQPGVAEGHGLLYLTPIIAVALEWLMFDVRPTLLTTLGIAVTCAGVAMVAWRPQRPGAAR
ncbi:MAG: hypothetical protein QUT27_11180 [candidate division Zixibacteria bacterium]|nr:hypothetical protein [candidate division Zixibacteria bacterium]